MKLPHKVHFDKTAELARKLPRAEIYKWLVTGGYFPETYVLPPCYSVTKRPRYGKVYCQHSKRNFLPKIAECQQVHFPKTELTDRTFGIIDPEIHSDIAYTVARNWKTILSTLFHKDNKVCSYSFPLPLDSKNPGEIGNLRSGRMIYEYIEMAENDIASIAYRYKYLVRTDVKNFYPSIYTHSIPWALHGKRNIRQKNRHNYNYCGNRLDKLFQNANDQCTNGIPIGPVVSDIIAEIILSAVDRAFSSNLSSNVIVLRFKDDYRILAKNEQEGREAVKILQAALREYRLELNDDKTEILALPDGVFRKWVSQYHAVNPFPKRSYSYKRFKEVYLAVVLIDRNNPGYGVIDRFLADLATSEERLRIKLNKRTLPRAISLLLMLGNMRTKAFPKVLAIIEAIFRSPIGASYSQEIVTFLEEYLQELCKREADNKYLIMWILYFIKSNGLESKLRSSYGHIRDPIVRAAYSSRFTVYNTCKDFKLFMGVKTIARRVSMLKHLDVFKPQ